MLTTQFFKILIFLNHFDNLETFELQSAANLVSIYINNGEFSLVNEFIQFS